MSEQLHESVKAALAKVIDPEIHKPITDLDMVESIDIDDAGHATIAVLLTVAGCPLQGTITTDVEREVSQVDGVTGVTVKLGTMSPEQRQALTTKLRGGRKQKEITFAQPGNLTRVIGVASGKGGVGKSSVTVNLAMALANRGRSVGLLDADIYGHSIPDMLGLGDARPTGVDDMIMPVPMMGMKVISMGMLKESRDQVIPWRGPILDRALQQLLADVYWGDLDYLILDLPPGTGDVALSIGQKLPGAQMIVVTTPQQAAAEVAERAGSMAGMMNQRVMGVVENMAWLEAECPHCGTSHRVELFGSGGGEQVATSLTDRLGYEVPLLAQVPLDAEVRQAGDDGMPVVVSAPDRVAAQALTGLAERIDSVSQGLNGVQLGVSPVNA